MKKVIPLLLVLLAAPFWSGAQAPPSVVVGQGPHHRTWGKIQEIQTPRGPITRTNVAYVELATGMNRWSAEQKEWTPASSRIELLQDGAVVRGLQYSVIFAPNLASAGAIDLHLPDGQRLTGHLLGLAYTEGDKSVMVAEVTDCTGEIMGAEQNELIFRNAFTDFAIDVKFVVARHKFCQDIVIRERLASPTTYGLTENARLEVLTEWTTAPAPQREVRVVEPAGEGQTALTDEELSFGSMLFGNGRAFAVGDEGADDAGIAVAKSWEQMRDADGNVRTFLVEKVPWRHVALEMQKLPPPQAKAGKAGPPGQSKAQDDALLAQGTNPGRVGPPGRPGEQAGAPSSRTLPDVAPNSPPSSSRTIAGLPAPRQKRAALKPMQMASAAVPGSQFDVPGSRLATISSPQSSPAFVLDYELVSSGTSLTFRGDTTYYVSGVVVLMGTNTFEGGTVIKFGTNAPRLQFYGTGHRINCLGSSYRPIILTARDDDSVGEILPSSTGSPTNYYGGYGVYLPSSSSTQYVEHVHVRFASFPFSVGATRTYLRHCQVLKGWTGVAAAGGSSSTVVIQNMLIEAATNAINASISGTKVSAEHLTVHHATNLNAFSRANLTLTNCLLVGVVNTNAYSGANIAIESSGSGVFQTVGAGAHYLAANSTNRNVGTTNINATLLTELRKLTTEPPVVLSNQYVTADTSLSPQPSRDTDTPDLGYHYDPIDYALCNVIVTNGVTLTIQPGTALGVFGNSSAGFWPRDGAKILSSGTATELVQLATYSLVQEQPSSAWSVGQPMALCLTPSWSVQSSPEMRFAFTRWSVPGGSNGVYHFYDYSGNTFNVAFRDCQFSGGRFVSQQVALAMTNCLFEGVLADMADADSTDLMLFNNTFYGGALTLTHYANGAWVAKDNLFDKTRVDGSASLSTITNDYNAYTFTNHGRLLATGTNDLVLSSSNITYQSSWLGRFYLPTDSALTNRGSQTADLASLYHYTTTTNQVKETNSTVDIGFHYVAVNSSGVPVDADSDGLPDYVEDADGDGAVNSGETDWTVSDTDGDGVGDYLEVLLGRNPLGPNPGSTNDTSSVLNLRVFTPLK